MSGLYFSEREAGPRERITEEIGAPFWGWLTVYISRLVDGAWFGGAFPDLCPDNDGGIFGTSAGTLSLCLAAEVPGITWPLAPKTVPPTLDILDLVEFCHRYVAKPAEGYYHKFYGRHHLNFDVAAGQDEYRQQVNRLFARNGLAFELRDDGRIVRLVPAAVRVELLSAEFRTGDEHLDLMLETARQKYLSPDPGMRRESLEKLWDAWERLKTLEDPEDKKRSIGLLLDRTCSEPGFRARLDTEARELTAIGNEMMIRHSEVDKAPLESGEQVDYLYLRMLAMILLLLKTRGRTSDDLPF